ncbi:MAG: exopolysaccharide biosynthesis protein [Solirubrobacteraceae bacterium]
MAGETDPNPRESVSAQLDRWITGDGRKTLDGLIELFGRGSFALLFVLLLGVPALPLPTGGATHVFEIIAVLLAVQLIAGRDQIWLPQRWRRLQLAGPRQQKFLNGLMKLIRWLERFSRPRLAILFEHRLTDVIFGLLVVLLTVAAFVAPPFSGLDTLPSLGVVLLALGVLLRDALVVVVAVVVGIAGIVLEIILGSAAINGVSSLF